MTFQFTSYNYIPDNPAPGWEATISCTQPQIHRLYGLTKSGGAGNGGTVYSINSNGNSYKTLAEFAQTLDGYNLVGELIEHPDGNFYGVFSNGGTQNKGAFFKISISGALTILYEFTDYEHDYYSQGIFLGVDNNFYGWRKYGGGNYQGNGSIYKITTAGLYTTLHYFYNISIEGYYPNSLIQASDGNLYGVTDYGGTISGGTIFKVSTSGQFTKLHDLSNSDGSAYYFNKLFTEDTNGDLIGSFGQGGSQGAGTIIKISKSGVFTKLKDFSSTDGYYPGPLTKGLDGNFYGICAGQGNGNALNYCSIFKITPTGTFTKLKDIVSSTDGFPYTYAGDGKLLLGANGNFYGTFKGYSFPYYGYSGNGTIYKITTSGIFTLLKNLTATIDGISPGMLTNGKDGNVYGKCTSGGVGNAGTYFQISTASGSLLLIDYATYISSLPAASDGNYYSFSNTGGASGFGTFSRSTQLGVITKIRDINNNLYGVNPTGNLLLAPDGNYYGMCTKGGANKKGTIFKMTPSGTLSKVLDFGGTIGATSPKGSLILATDGKMYGIGNNGVVFSITTAPGSYAVKSNVYASANGSLLQLTNGNFYGTTSDGGANNKGTIFEIDGSTGYSNTLKDLVETTDGSEPMGSLTLASDGYMYGLCSKGGENGDGTIFRVGIIPGDFTTIISLNEANPLQRTGKNPSGSLYAASNGQLYGTTDFGGKDSGFFNYNNTIYSGTVFKLKLPGDYIKLFDLNPSSNTNSGDADNPILTGSNPIGGNYIEGGDGYLYGVCAKGGNRLSIPNPSGYVDYTYYGTIYKINKSGKEYIKLRDFEPNPDGNQPEFSGLISVAGVCSDPIVSVSNSNASEVCEGSIISLKVSVTGASGALTYQWQMGTYTVDYNGYGNINSATNFLPLLNDSITNGVNTTTLTITVNPNMNSFAFRCSVTDACGNTQSALLGFKVLPNISPVVTVTTASLSICSGTGVTFRAYRTDPTSYSNITSYNNYYAIYQDGAFINVLNGSYYDGITFTLPGIANGSKIFVVHTTVGQSCLLKNIVTSAGITMSVYPLPIVSLQLEPDTITVTTPITTLAGGMPLGGIYSGAATFAPNYFFPQSAGLGVKPITYTYKNPGCTVTAQQNLTVIKDKQSVSGLYTIFDQALERKTLSLNGIVGGLSGNPVSFSINTNPATGIALLTGKVISFLGIGNVTITATQLGNDQYNDADTARKVFAISSKSGQYITGFGTLPNLAVGNSYTINGVSGGITGNPIVFTVAIPLLFQ